MIQAESLLFKSIGVGAILILSGFLARDFKIKVNYTRKINHFALFFIPIFVDYQLNTATFTDIDNLVVSGFLATTALMVFWEPIRNAIPLAQLTFEGFDRPEDRPYTLVWIITQFAVGYLVIIPFAWYFGQIGLEELVMIPILINAVGDGLAEPVGVKFGKHPYTTKGLFVDREYQRTLEGSACVWIVGLLAIWLYKIHFNSTEFIVSLLLIPPIMTITEAKSPHTWDTPFLFFSGYVSLLAICEFF
tara:strand:- start:3507 stop:4247 length:741 start_codon:yes stop_codon:yes gene_type:complete